MEGASQSSVDCNFPRTPPFDVRKIDKWKLQGALHLVGMIGGQEDMIEMRFDMLDGAVNPHQRAAACQASLLAQSLLMASATSVLAAPDSR